jgi:hypothetical protein
MAGAEDRSAFPHAVPTEFETSALALSGADRVNRASRGRSPLGPTQTMDDRSQTMQFQQPRVRLGRVYDERTAEDGTRVLVDRLWPRGLTKDRADLDEWCKQIAPSSALRKWYGHDPDRFAEFSRRYRQ